MPHPRPRVPPYLLMLVVSFALLCLIGYQTLKDRKISGDLLLEKQALQELLKKEKKKIRELQQDLSKLSSQKEQLNGVKDGLTGQLIELKRVKTLTDEGKRKLESSLALKENEVKDLKEKVDWLDKKEEEIRLMKKEMTRKDAEISELKEQIRAFSKHSMEQTNVESTNTKESAASVNVKKKNGKKETSKEQSDPLEQKIPEEAKDAADLDPEDPTMDENSNIDMSKEKNDTEDVDTDDEELKVDDGEEALKNEAGDDAEAEKTIDLDDTDDQSDIDIDAVNKSDLDENDMAAME